jgi:hypothetical protein
MELPLFHRFRDRSIRPDDLGVHGAGKRLEQCPCPSAIGWKVPLLRPDPGCDDPITRREMGRQTSGDSEADDSGSSALSRRLERGD